MSSKRTYEGVVIRTTAKGTSISIRYHDASGRRVFVQLGYAPEWTPKRAYEERRRRMVAVERGEIAPTGKTTFDVFANEWLDRTASRGLKVSTARSYKTLVQKHLVPAFGRDQLTKISAEKVERYVAQKLRAGATPRSVNSHLQCLGAILGDAWKRGLISSNSVDRVSRPKQRKTSWRILTPEEAGEVERALAEQDEPIVRAMFLCFMETGVRRGELLGLHWRHVSLADPAGPVIRVEETWTCNQKDIPKSDYGVRTIPISNRLAGELMDLRAASSFDGDDERVFASSTGGAFDVHVYYEKFKTACTAAGITDRIRPCHDLRHSSITNGAISGMSAASLQARAGHSSYSTTQRYISLSGETFRDEAKLLEDRLYGKRADEKDAVAIR